MEGVMTEEHDASREWSYPKSMIKGIVRMVLFLAVVFALAGRLDYWQGWVFCGVMLVIGLCAVYLFRHRQDLVKERMKPGPGMKWWWK